MTLGLPRRENQSQRASTLLQGMSLVWQCLVGQLARASSLAWPLLAQGSLGWKPFCGSEGSACYLFPWPPLAVSLKMQSLFPDPFLDLSVGPKKRILTLGCRTRAQTRAWIAHSKGCRAYGYPNLGLFAQPHEKSKPKFMFTGEGKS